MKTGSGSSEKAKLAEAFGQVAPGNAGADAPNNSVDKQSVGFGDPALLAAVGVGREMGKTGIGTTGKGVGVKVLSPPRRANDAHPAKG